MKLSQARKGSEQKRGNQWRKENDQPKNAINISLHHIFTDGDFSRGYPAQVFSKAVHQQDWDSVAIGIYSSVAISAGRFYRFERIAAYSSGKVRFQVKPPSGHGPISATSHRLGS